MLGSLCWHFVIVRSRRSTPSCPEMTDLIIFSLRTRPAAPRRTFIFTACAQDLVLLLSISWPKVIWTEMNHLTESFCIQSSFFFTSPLSYSCSGWGSTVYWSLLSIIWKVWHHDTQQHCSKTATLFCSELCNYTAVRITALHQPCWCFKGEKAVMNFPGTWCLNKGT